MAGLAERVDTYQRRNRLVGFPLAVVYKFFDDQGNYLAAILTYYGFVAIFPLLLIGSSVLGFLLQGNQALEQEVLASALSQFPVVGTQLGAPGGLQGSTSAVVVGGLTALYGVVGLGQAAQNAVNTAWAVPRNSRLNPVVSRLRSLLLFVLAGLALLVLAVVSSIASNLQVFGSRVDVGVRLLAGGASVLLVGIVLTAMMRFSTTVQRSFRSILPGAVAVAVMWQLLQLVGGIYVRHVVNRVSEMNGVFALVLGLVALLYVAAVMAILGMELNVVLTKRLYPRALLTPFTDAVDLTGADRRVYTEYAQAQRHKGFEHVEVTFLPRTTGDGAHQNGRDRRDRTDPKDRTGRPDRTDRQDPR